MAVRRLRAATEIMRALDGETDIGRVLELVVKRARALVDARWTAMLLVSGAELEIEEIAGDVDRALLGTRVPIEGSISGQVLKSMRPERVADLSSRVMVLAGGARPARRERRCWCRSCSARSRSAS